MSKGDGSPGGSNVGVVVLIVALLLAVPCCGGLALFGAGFFFTAVGVSSPPAEAIESMPAPTEIALPEPLIPEPAATTEPESPPPGTSEPEPATTPAP